MRDYMAYRRTVLACLALAILGFTIYVNSLEGEFIWDDHVLIANNKYIESWNYIPEIFSQDIGAPAGERYNFYRPVQILTYKIDYLIWRFDAGGFRLTNIIIHILAVLCIYWFFSIIFKDSLLSFWASLLFLVHPVHTGAVYYISGRPDLLALLFMLLCYIFYIKSLGSG